MCVGNLPLCWPVIRLALGSKGDTSNPSYPNGSYPDSSGRRMHQSRTLTTKASLWAKLDDEDGRTELSRDQGSEIELVDQYVPDLVKQPYQTEAAITSGTDSRHNSGDHITVVTKVDITTK